MLDFDLDPTESEDFFVWEECVNPGKYQCKKCGALFDEEDQCMEWCEERQCYLFECPDCGAVGEMQT